MEGILEMRLIGVERLVRCGDEKNSIRDQKSFDLA